MIRYLFLLFFIGTYLAASDQQKALDIRLTRIGLDIEDFSKNAKETINYGLDGNWRVFKRQIRNMYIEDLMILVKTFNFLNDKELKVKAEKKIIQLDLSLEILEQVIKNFKILSSKTLINISQKIISTENDFKDEWAKFIALNLDNKKIIKVLNQIKQTAFKNSQKFFDVLSNNLESPIYDTYLIKNLTLCDIKIDNIFISPQGHRLLIQTMTECHNQDRFCYLYALDGEKSYELIKKFTSAGPIGFSPDGEKIIYTFNGFFMFRDALDGKIVKSKKHPMSFKAKSILFNSDSTNFFATLYTGQTKIFDLKKFEVIGFLDDESLKIPFEEKISLEQRNNIYEIFDLNSQKKICSLPKDLSPIIAVAVNPNSNIIAIGLHSGKVIIFGVY